MKNLNLLNGIKIAHRGLWNNKYPENSMGAFRQCINNGVAFEFDVHMLKDDTLVVIHDDDTERVTGTKVILRDANYNEINNLKLQGTDYTIPRFKEVLDLVDGKVLLDIEIKTDVKKIKICHLISKYLDDYKGNFIVKSFNPIFLIWFRMFRPNYIRGLLLSKINYKSKFWYLFFNIWFNWLVKPDFVAVSYKSLSNKIITKIRKKGIPILIYTIKEKDLIDYEYDGYIYEE